MKSRWRDGAEELIGSGGDTGNRTGKPEGLRRGHTCKTSERVAEGDKT